MTPTSLSSEAPWRNRAKSRDFSKRQQRALPKHPICPCCDVPMWLSKVRTKPETVEYFYECKVCGDKMSVADD
jgi:transcription elongation factor Elf1